VDGTDVLIFKICVTGSRLGVKSKEPILFRFFYSADVFSSRWILSMIVWWHQW